MPQTSQLLAERGLTSSMERFPTHPFIDFSGQGPPGDTSLMHRTKSKALTLKRYVTCPLPAPLTSSSPLSRVHVGPWAVPHICQHTAASGPSDLPFPLLDLSSPDFCLGHPPTSFRSLLRKLFSGKTPHHSLVTPIYFSSKHLQGLSYSIYVYLFGYHLSFPLECKLHEGRGFVYYYSSVPRLGCGVSIVSAQ